MAIVVVLGLAGIAAVLFGTGGIIGLHVDSAPNVEAARNLLRGYGLSQMSESGLDPVTLSAPLYPAMLATLGIFGLDPIDGAKWLNAFLFGATIIFVGYAIHRCTHSTYASSLGAFLILASPHVLYVHMMALTEPPFIFFSMLGVFLAATYTENSRALNASAAAAALACLARYPGLAVVLTGIAGVLLLTTHTRDRRIRDAGVFGLVASLPIALWFLRNVLVAHVMTGRGAGFHPITAEKIKPALLAYSSWLVPESLPTSFGIFRNIFLIAVMGSFVSLSLALLRANRRAHRTEPADPLLSRCSTLLLLYVSFYTGFLILDASLAGTTRAPLTFRYQVPMFVALTVLIVSQGHHLLRGVRTRFLRVATLAFCVAFAGSYTVRGAAWVINSYSQGLGYASKAWRQSETIRGVKALPSGIWVYSNVPEVIYLLTGRLADSPPRKPGSIGGLPESEYHSRLAGMGRKVRNREAVIVYFREAPGRDFPGGRDYLPSEQELKMSLPLKVIEESSDGVIYGAAE